MLVGEMLKDGVLAKVYSAIAHALITGLGDAPSTPLQKKNKTILYTGFPVNDGQFLKR